MRMRLLVVAVPLVFAAESYILAVPQHQAKSQQCGCCVEIPDTTIYSAYVTASVSSDGSRPGYPITHFDYTDPNDPTAAIEIISVWIINIYHKGNPPIDVPLPWPTILAYTDPGAPHNQIRLRWGGPNKDSADVDLSIKYIKLNRTKQFVVKPCK